MKLSIYLLMIFLFLLDVSSENCASFCLCALKSVPKDYALLTTDRTPPRYRSSDTNDIGFYVVPSHWKAVNNATWMELGTMINAPSGMYTYISLDGIHPLNDGSTLNTLRSSHLADILAEYRLILDKVDLYHENLIRNQTKTCAEQTDKSLVALDLKKWQQFFVRQNNSMQ